MALPSMWYGANSLKVPGNPDWPGPRLTRRTLNRRSKAHMKTKSISEQKRWFAQSVKPEKRMWILLLLPLERHWMGLGNWPLLQNEPSTFSNWSLWWRSRRKYWRRLSRWTMERILTVPGVISLGLSAVCDTTPDGLTRLRAELSTLAQRTSITPDESRYLRCLFPFWICPTNSLI